MEIKKRKNKITIIGLEDFDIIQTLSCGQIFRYTIDGDTAIVYSLDKKATIHFDQEKLEIFTDDIDYFYNFFDLDRDYSEIKRQLRQDKMLRDAVDYGHGIRILKNDFYEMLISFIISANNNISRIKNSINYLCSNFGEDKGDYYAFPTLKSLKTATIYDFRLAGLGYRAEQMFDTVQRLTEHELQTIKTQDRESQFRFLTSLKGVGEKVANCVMLFGLGNQSVFPVDTWINKVYNHLTGTTTTDRKKISKELSRKYKDLSGFAQQYFFYYFRDNKLK